MFRERKKTCKMSLRYNYAGGINTPLPEPKQVYIVYRVSNLVPVNVCRVSYFTKVRCVYLMYFYYMIMVNIIFLDLISKQ